MSLTKYKIVSNDDIYEAFPDVVLTNNNTMVSVFLECTHHGDRSYTRIMMTRSSDKGRTWSDKTPFTKANNSVDGSWNCPRISKLPDGRIAIIVDRIFNFNEERLGKNYLYIGDEFAENFSEAVELPGDGIVPDKLVVTKNGRWIVSYHKACGDFLAQSMWYSDNEGKTWSEEIVIASQEGLKLCEGCIVEVEENVLVCFLRENSMQGYDCYKSISKDNGLTWEGMFNVPIPGCHRPVIGQLQSGVYMLTHRFLQGGKGWVGSWTQNLFATFMSSESVKAEKREEQATRIFPLDFDRSPVSDIGYSGWVQFDDGEIYVVYYIVDDAPNGQIRGVSFNEEDVLIGGFGE